MFHKSSACFGVIVNNIYALFNTKILEIKAFSVKCSKSHIESFLCTMDFLCTSTRMPNLKHIRKYEHMHYLQLKYY